MNEISFIWDKQKVRSNKRKHGASFEEAQTVFYDDNALEFFDPDHSETEDRFIMLGMSFIPRFIKFAISKIIEQRGIIPRFSRIKYCRIFETGYKTRVLVVCHCVREEGSVIRIISARKATKHEMKNYQEGTI